MTKPTIEELERILAGGDGPQRIEMLPNGEIRAVSDWQPIETAEKTTKSRLVWCPERKNTYCVYWGSYFTGEEDLDGWCYFGCGGQLLRETPTHWMPLPPPPLERDGGDENSSGHDTTLTNSKPPGGGG